MTPAGLPHSDVSGSKRACRSPKLIAACCVLHRLSVPRHPPSTLSNLTIKCLDLMRSAVARPNSNVLVHIISLSTTHIQLSTNLMIAKIGAGHNAWFVPSADARAVLRVRVLTDQRHPGLRVFGGADRARTDDPLLAKQVLSQLSGSPGSGRQ